MIRHLSMLHMYHVSIGNTILQRLFLFQRNLWICWLHEVNWIFHGTTKFIFLPVGRLHASVPAIWFKIITSAWNTCCSLHSGSQSLFLCLLGIVEYMASLQLTNGHCLISMSHWLSLMETLSYTPMSTSNLNKRNSDQSVSTLHKVLLSHSGTKLLAPSKCQEIIPLLNLVTNFR